MHLEVVFVMALVVDGISGTTGVILCQKVAMPCHGNALLERMLLWNEKMRFSQEWRHNCLCLQCAFVGHPQQKEFQCSFPFIHLCVVQSKTKATDPSVFQRSGMSLLDTCGRSWDGDHRGHKGAETESSLWQSQYDLWITLYLVRVCVCINETLKGSNC